MSHKYKWHIDLQTSLERMKERKSEGMNEAIPPLAFRSASGSPSKTEDRVSRNSASEELDKKTRITVSGTSLQDLETRIPVCGAMVKVMGTMIVGPAALKGSCTARRRCPRAEPVGRGPVEGRDSRTSGAVPVSLRLSGEASDAK